MARLHPQGSTSRRGTVRSHLWAALVGTVCLLCLYLGSVFLNGLHSGPMQRPRPRGSRLLQVGQGRVPLDLQDYSVSVTRMPKIRNSTYECMESGEIERVCIFQDVYLWQGSVLFVSEDPEAVIPRVTLDFRLKFPHLWLKPKRATPEEIEGAMKRAQQLVNWGGRHDEVYVWSGNMNNYAHFTGERLPSIHNTLCKYLGRCTYDNTTGLHLVLDKPEPDPWPAFAEEGLHCISESRHMNLRDPEMMGSLVAVRRLLVGVGSDCRGATWCQGTEEGLHRPNLSARNYALYRKHMGACLGFDASAQARLTPRPTILLVDRHFHSGRHMLNVEQVVLALRQRYGGFADVDLQYMDDKTMAEQAHLWNSAALVIHMHGAACGNWAFLAHKAAVVVTTLAREDGSGGYGDIFPSGLEHDLRGVTDVTHTSLNISFVPYAQLQRSKFDQKAWASIPAEERMALLETGQCSNVKAISQSTCWRWMMVGFNLEIPLEKLLPAVDEQLHSVYSRQGRTPPAHL